MREKYIQHVENRLESFRTYLNQVEQGNIEIGDVCAVIDSCNFIGVSGGATIHLMEMLSKPSGGTFHLRKAIEEQDGYLLCCYRNL